MSSQAMPSQGASSTRQGGSVEADFSIADADSGVTDVAIQLNHATPSEEASSSQQEGSGEAGFNIVAKSDCDPATENPLESQKDVISNVLGYCPRASFLFIAGISKCWREAWIADGAKRETGVRLATATPSRTEWILGDATFNYSSDRLGGIYCLMAEAGNLGGLMAVARKDSSWPKSITAKAGQVAKGAAKGGHLGVLKWARAHGCLWDTLITSEAAAGGHLQILLWARAQGCPWDAETCTRAAENGQMKILQWARENGCPWNFRGYAVAASNGHLELLQWLKAQRFPDWETFTCDHASSGGHFRVLQWAKAQGCRWTGMTCVHAAESGNLEMLQWARALGCPWDTSTCDAAVRGGHLEVLQWARTHGCPLRFHRKQCSNAAKAGHLELLQWLRAQGCQWDEETCLAAVRGGHVEVLQWLRANGCPWNYNTMCLEAVKCGHLEVLQWLMSVQSCAPSIGAALCNQAARAGQLELLQWLTVYGFQWNEVTGLEAIKGGHWEVLQWLSEQGFRGIIGPALCNQVARVGQLKLDNWLWENGFQWNEAAFLEAIRGGQLQVLQWLSAQDCPATIGPELCSYAARVGQLELLQWLRASGFQWNETTFLEAFRGEHLEVLQWLRAQGCPGSFSLPHRNNAARFVQQKFLQ